MTLAYGGLISNGINRPDALVESGITLASYRFMGLGTQVGLKYDAASATELTYQMQKMKMKQVMRPAILWILLIVTVEAADLEGFYLNRGELLENRLEEFLKSGPQMLVNYPAEIDPEAHRKESGVMMNYGLDATTESVVRDIRNAIKQKKYYGLIMVAASLELAPNRNEIKKNVVDEIGSLLGEDGYQNAILAYCVKTLIEVDFIADGDKIKKENVRALTQFIKELKGKTFDPKGYPELKNVVNDINSSIVIAVDN